jgi:4-hydroxy-2-oxoglutarate aldolase
MPMEVSGILAPITTPFVDERVDLGKLRQNVRKYGQTNLTGFFALGSNGEGKSLSNDEKRAILAAIVSERAKHQILIAGTGFESTYLSIEFSKQAADIGVDYVSILTPSYYRKQHTDDAFIRYYIEIAESIPIPLFVYNVPGYTGVTLSYGVIKELSTHPNIAGMKDTSPGQITQYLEASASGFAVLSGTINTLFTALILGAPGGVVSLANAFPNECYKLYELTKGGSIKEARELNSKLFQLNRSISGSFGVAGVKYAAELAEYHGGDPRRPLLPLVSSEKKIIREAVDLAGFL